VAVNPRDELSLRRIINVPPRGIGATSVQRLVAHGTKTGRGLWASLCEAHAVAGLPKAAVAGATALIEVLRPRAQSLRHATGSELPALVGDLFEKLQLKDTILAADDAPTVMQRRIQNLDAVVRALDRFAEGVTGGGKGGAAPLQEFLRSTSLSRDSEEDALAATDRVTLMTLHSAKGLEFPYVLMVGVEEDLLPHKRTLELGGDLAEERRLCYVGMTRARTRLWLTHASRRKRHGTEAPRSPSRFLEEVPGIDAVRRSRRDVPCDDEGSEELAAAFFQKMREQLGMD
jgi:DNA helicase-2/ATP-dependent DNA helicase PcrA